MEEKVESGLPHNEKSLAYLAQEIARAGNWHSAAFEAVLRLQEEVIESNGQVFVSFDLQHQFEKATRPKRRKW